MSPGPTFSAPPKENDGGFGCLTGCEQGAKIGVCGHQHAIFSRSVVEDGLITCRLHAIVPYVYRVVALLPQPFCNRR